MPIIFDAAYRFKGKGEYDSKPHIHNNCWEIIQTFSSDGSMIMNNKMYPMLFGSVYLINSNYLHYSSPKDAENYLRNKIAISDSYLENILKSCHGEFIIDIFKKDIGRQYTPDLQKSQEIDRLFSSVNSLVKKDKNENIFEITILLMQMLSLIVKSDDLVISNYSSTLTSILVYIDQNFTDDITLDEIAKHFFITKSYLCRLFKNNLNLTVMEYILLKRLSHAKMLLKTTDHPISNIAYESGFSSASYFNHIFRKSENMTPKEYKHIVEQIAIIE